MFNSNYGTFDDCTITGNTATSAGGGLYSQTGATINGTIVANNSARGDTSNIGTMNSNSVVSGSYNLIGPGSSGGLSSTNNLLDVSNPVLGTLGNYGGVTETIPVLPGSPAIGAGTSISGITTDERGVTRPASRPRHRRLPRSGLHLHDHLGRYSVCRGRPAVRRTPQPSK